MFCSTSYSQLESILHFHTQRSLNGSQYKIGGRPRGEGVLEYGQYQTKWGRGIKKFSFWPDVLCEWPQNDVAGSTVCSWGSWMENFPNGVRKPKIVGKTTSSKKLGRQDCQVKCS